MSAWFGCDDGHLSSEQCLGYAQANKRATDLAKSRICSDHQEAGSCVHADCYALDQLIADINKETTNG